MNLNLFNRGRKEQAPRNDPFVIGERSLFEATKFIQEIITDQDVWGPDETARRQRLLELAQAGEPAAIEEAMRLVEIVLRHYSVRVPGMDTAAVARRIYSYAWGWDVLEDLYDDPEVDEIQVNGPAEVFVLRQGRHEKPGVAFKDDEHVRKIATRLFLHDRGVSLTASTPVVESIRRDGTRITATCPPVTATWTLTIRKHDTFEMSPQNLVERGTASEELLELLALMVRGRANILIAGGVGSGKTSLLRYLVRHMPPALRLVVMENDRELRLREHYPGRNVFEMEEHPDLGYPLTMLFRTALRESPDVLILGEIRGQGEGREAIKACTRGHDGSMATIHFSSPAEAVTGYGKILLEEGMNLPIQFAETWVAQAFNIIIQMHADSERGVKKIIQVTEIGNRDNAVWFNDLVTWQPSPGDYLSGEWVFVNPPGDALLRKLYKYGVRPGDVLAFWGREA